MQPLTEFTDQYLETLFWSECQEDGGPMDDDFGPEDLAPEALEEIKKDCTAFFWDSRDLLDQTPDTYTYGQAGHDFALTRNGHGAGFWDRGLEKLGDDLTAAADSYGTQNLYIGDDGLVYV